MKAELYQTWRQKKTLVACFLWLLYNFLLDFFGARLAIMGNLDRITPLPKTAEAFVQYGMLSAYNLFYWILFFMLVYIIQPWQSGMFDQEVACGRSAWQVVRRRLRFVQLLLLANLIGYILIPYGYACLVRGIGDTKAIGNFLITIFFYEATHFLIGTAWTYGMIVVYLLVREAEVWMVLALIHIMGNNVLYGLRKSVAGLDAIRYLWMPYWYNTIPQKRDIWTFLPVIVVIVCLQNLVKIILARR